MIRAILIINKNGNPIVHKFYFQLEQQSQQKIIQETYKILIKRRQFLCNFVEGGLQYWGLTSIRLVYRLFLDLFVIFAIDENESELSVLDVMDVFVEGLKCVFRNPTEFDLFKNVEKVYYLIDEVVQGGMVLETNLDEILRALNEQKMIEKKENPIKETIKEVKEAKMFL
eukprot:TRINITY_DN473_c0_g3_i2.p1 TRINITY_DN473_c0_g3~~TRINITY_DN473_c0_g3_i2.p1  ORF type:complete len:170 (-),score=30.21 TRINITY_DN473_c0_g3_i2:109-618(-)